MQAGSSPRATPTWTTSTSRSRRARPARSSSPRRRPLPARTLAQLESRLAELAGAPVELERPTKAEHGDYATNVALRTAPVNGRAPRELAQELAGKALALEDVERAEV